MSLTVYFSELRTIIHVCFKAFVKVYCGDEALPNVKHQLIVSSHQQVLLGSLTVTERVNNTAWQRVPAGQ